MKKKGAVNILSAVVLIPIALILIAALGGVAINLVFNISGTAAEANESLGEVVWEPETLILWNILPIIAIIVIFIALLAVIGLKITGKL